MVDIYQANFLGDDGIIRFKDDVSKTYFLLSTDKKTLIPFVSSDAVFNRYGIAPEQLEKEGKITVLDSSQVASPAGALYGFKTVPVSEGVRIDGTLPKNDSYDQSSMNLYYGQQKNEDAQNKQAESLFRYMSFWKGVDSGLSSNILTEVMNDPQQLGYYINALAYGGYTANDVYRDLKRRDLTRQGDTQASNLTVIDPSKTKTNFLKTSAGQTSANAINVNPPTVVGGVDSSLFNLSIFQIPNEAYKAIIPVVDINSPEFKAEAESIQAAYYDVLMQSLDAKTDQEKAIADYAYQKLRDDVNRRYGIALSDNAVTAWNQVANIQQTMSGRGLAGSGVEERALQEYSQQVRKADQRLRDAKLDEEKTAELNYLLKSGTDQQISDYITKINADTALTPEQKKQITSMFQPTEETKQAFSLNALKAKYPTLDENILKQYSEALIDPSGNLRSELSQKLYTSKILDIFNKGTSAQEQKTAYQQGAVLQQKVDKEEEAMRPFTSGQDFIGTTEEQTAPEPTPAPAPAPSITPTPASAPVTPAIDYSSPEVQSRAPSGFKINPTTGHFEKVETVAPALSATGTKTTIPSPTSMVTISHPTSGTQEVMFGDYESWWKKPEAGGWTLK